MVTRSAKSVLEGERNVQIPVELQPWMDLWLSLTKGKIPLH